VCESATIPTVASASQPITAYTIFSSLGKIAFALVSAFLFLLISFPLPLFGFTTQGGRSFVKILEGIHIVSVLTALVLDVSGGLGNPSIFQHDYSNAGDVSAIV